MTPQKSLSYLVQSFFGLKVIAFVEYLNRKNSPQFVFYEPTQFYWTKELEKNTFAIQSELEQLLHQKQKIPNFETLSVEQEKIIAQGEWNTYFFCAYGQFISKNCEQCPETFSSIKKVPGIQTAFFSIFAPHTRIHPHRGVFNGVLRYHLALKVPVDFRACALRINNEIRHWELGKSIIFDDTFEHDAWNNSDEARVVLFIDFEKPLPFWLKPINRALMYLLRKSPFIQQIPENIEKYKSS